MSSKKLQTSSNVPYHLQYVSTTKQRDSPTSSILKSPTPIFLTSRNSSVRTRRLKFANGPDLGEAVNDVREGSFDSATTSSTIGEISDILRENYENSGLEGKLIEVALSPVKKMQVSPDSWNAFLEYGKYNDHSNETEKTDYTYSRLSKFRNKEIIPGFRIRPNLSRRPIHQNVSYESLSRSWSPEATYCVKRTMYETGSEPSRKLNANSLFEEKRTHYQNEMSDYSRCDGYSNDETLRVSDKYQMHSGLADDKRVLRSGRDFDFTTADQGSHFRKQWDFDETDDDIITSTNRLEKSSYSAVKNFFLFLSTVFMSLVHGISSPFILLRDLFSKYILRRDTYPLNYSSSAWKSWSESTPYPYGAYKRRTEGRFSSWWHRSFLYALYNKIMSTISNSSEYVRTKYYRSSRKGKLLLFLIPFLLLFALWLLKAEGDDAYVSNQMTALKCKANQFFSPARNQMNSLQKKIGAYMERMFGQSLEPIWFLFRSLFSLVAAYINWALSLLYSILAGIFTVFRLLKELLSNFWVLFTDTFSDAVAKKDYISSSMYDFFSGIILAVLKGSGYVLGGVGGLIESAFEYLKWFFVFEAMPRSDEIKIESIKSDFPDRDLAHWESLRKRIEELENDLKKLKEEKSVGSVVHQRQLDENLKAFQKYQVMMNEALRRQSSKPVHLSKTSIQYFLDNVTDDLKKWVLTHFVLKTDAKDIDESQFAVLMAKYSNRSGEEIKMLQDEFSRFVTRYNAELTSLKSDINYAQYQDLNGNDLSLSVIKRIVSDEIKLHDADKTGKVDFALQSAGGQVLGVKCTKNFNHCFKYNDIFGLQVCAQSRRNAPEEAINPGVAPGQCWAFVGSQGFLILELSHSIVVSGFTMEHISRLLAPNGHIDSAPRRFRMWGLRSEFDLEPYLFGDYEYKDNNETYQYFPVMNYTAQPYKIVELNIESNHGNPNYTCLYRIRVHGDIP